MNFVEQPPSKQWAALKYRGEKFAEVWFKPDGELSGLSIRIPQASFKLPGLQEQLTLENLLLAIGLAPEAVDSWRYGEVSGADLQDPLAAPSPDQAHLSIFIRLKPPTVAGTDTGTLEISEAGWDELESRWKAILAIEATIDGQRMSSESLVTQMEAAWNKTLNTEEKLNAPRGDISQWEKGKKRLLDTLPKVKDVIHRCNWALGAPERKQLGGLYTEHIEPRILCPALVDALKQIEALQKARQVLLQRGTAVQQEARTILAEVQRALMTLQNNAAAHGKKKRDAAKGGKFMKDVRRATGN